MSGFEVRWPKPNLAYNWIVKNELFPKEKLEVEQNLSLIWWRLLSLDQRGVLGLGVTKGSPTTWA
jgi:hypothetical protein